MVKPLIDCIDKVKIPKDFFELEETLKNLEQWGDLVETLKCSLNMITDGVEEYNEVDVECKCAQVETAMKEQKKYAIKLQKQIFNLITTEDKIHKEETIQIANLMRDIEKIKAKANKVISVQEQ